MTGGQIRACCLSVGGHDPSGEAGIVRDSITFASFGLKPLSVLTCVTVQNGCHFQSLSWNSDQYLIDALKSMKDQPLLAAKISVSRDSEMLTLIIDQIRKVFPSLFLLWDPVLESSTGFRFFSRENLASVGSILSRLDLCTPNLREALELSSSTDLISAGTKLSRHCPVLVTGVCNEKESVSDYLFVGGPLSDEFEHVFCGTDRHGTGCLFSASLLAQITCGASIEEAVRRSQLSTRNYREDEKFKADYNDKIPQQGL